MTVFPLVLMGWFYSTPRERRASDWYLRRCVHANLHSRGLILSNAIFGVAKYIEANEELFLDYGPGFFIHDSDDESKSRVHGDPDTIKAED